MICAACSRPIIAGLGACFDCELVSAAAPPRVGRRYRVHGAAHQERLARLVTSLCPDTPADFVGWLVSGRTFDIVAELNEPQERALGAILTSAGAAASGSFATGPRALRVTRDGKLLQKGGAALAIGVATAALGVPLVPFASAAILVYLAARGVRAVRREITIPRARVDQVLGPLDLRVVAEARAARARIETPAILDLARNAVASGSELSGALRQEAAHLTSLELQRADAEVSDLVAAVLRLTVAADTRVRSLSGETRTGYRLVGGAEEPTLSAVRRIVGDLGDLRKTAILVRPGEPPGAPVAEIVRAAVRLQAECRKTLEATLVATSTAPPPPVRASVAPV